MSGRDRHWPDGLEDRHAAPPAKRHALPVGLVVLSVVMAAALLGMAGREGTASASGGGVRLEWHAPTVIRNGEFLEMRITLQASEEIPRPVLGVDASIWEDLTINTFIPAAVDESSRDGEFRFEFAPMGAGTSQLVKVDAQINPDTLGGNAGVVTVYDGDEELVSLPVQIEVLP
jgi:hypothetical protein